MLQSLRLHRKRSPLRNSKEHFIGMGSLPKVDDLEPVTIQLALGYVPGEPLFDPQDPPMWLTFVSGPLCLLQEEVEFVDAAEGVRYCAGRVLVASSSPLRRLGLTALTFGPGTVPHRSTQLQALRWTCSKRMTLAGGRRRLFKRNFVMRSSRPKAARLGVRRCPVGMGAP